MGLFRKDRLVTPEELATAVKNAVTDATTSATLAAHISQCERDKAEMKAQHTRMHSENQDRFGKLEAQNEGLREQNNRLMRYMWFAMGAVLAAQFVFGKEGLDLAGKLLGHG